MKMPLWRRGQKDELEEEIRSHLREAARERIERGEAPEQALAAARREFGNESVVREVTRDMWGWASLDVLVQDVRYGVRQLLRAPGFTLTAILTLALGIGANTAIFSVVSAVLFRTLPVQEPHRLVPVRNSGGGMFSSFSYPNYKDVRDQNTAFSDLIAYRFAPVGLSHEGVSQRVWCFMVSGNYFAGLGIRPHLGRLLTPEDDASQGAHPVAVLSYESWQKRFGARADIIGQQIIINGRAYAIVGVGPEGFRGTEVVASPEVFFPIAMQAELEPGVNLLVTRAAPVFFVIGRMKPGVTAAQAQTNLEGIGKSLAEDYPEENKTLRIALGDLGTLSMGPIRGASVGFATLLFAVSGLVLALACANLSNMLLARATERRDETAIRLAMGASRGRLIRQLLTESTLLALAGGVLGMLPALWPIRFSVQMRPPADFPMILDVHWDYRVLAFGFFITLLTGLGFGLLPALQATKADVSQEIKGGREPGKRHGWTRATLIAAQVGLSLVLLTGAGLMVRALQQVQRLDLGYDPQNAVEVSFDLRMQGYDRARGREFQREMLEKIRALPGVEAAGITDVVPVDLHFGNSLVFIEGAPEERTSSTPRTLTNIVSPGYFAAMGTKLLAGRDFDDNDRAGNEQVAIVSQAFARKFWPNENAIGKRFSLADARTPKFQVIGVVQDGKYNSLSAGPQPYVARCSWQAYASSTALVVRSNTQNILSVVRREVQQKEPAMPLTAAPVSDRLAVALLPARVATSVLGAFALLGVLLAAIGIYGVISYAVSRRTRELGIRMALGADKLAVLKLVIAQGMKPALIGALVGLPATYALTRLMTSFLFGLSATDPLTYTATLASLSAVALLACYIPARRATRVDPLVALRQD